MMAPRPLAIFVPPPSGEFAAINAHPIFSPTRKSVEPAPVGAAAAPPPPPSVALIGVILDGQTRLALVKTPASPLETGVSLGASIGGWQLTQIFPDRIVLHLGTSDDEIKLESNRAKDEPANAHQPPAQPVSGAQINAGAPDLSTSPAAPSPPQDQSTTMQNGADKPH